MWTSYWGLYVYLLSRLARILPELYVRRLQYIWTGLLWKIVTGILSWGALCILNMAYIIWWVLVEQIIFCKEFLAGSCPPLTQVVFSLWPGFLQWENKQWLYFYFLYSLYLIKKLSTYSYRKHINCWHQPTHECIQWHNHALAIWSDKWYRPHWHGQNNRI